MFRAMLIPLRTLPLAIGVLAALVLPAAAATGDWVENGKARIRLLAAGIDGTGHLNAALEIELAPGWKTYWRTPGDAGIPPVIDFSASRNLGNVDVAFPVPERHDDGYTVTNTYEGSVVLPLTATLAAPAGGADLALKLDIGVCSDVCVPAHFEATLSVPPGAPDPDATAVIAAAAKSLPARSEPGVFAVDQVKRDGGTDKRPSFAMTATVPEADKAQVFVEGAADWYADIPKFVSATAGRALYRFNFDTLGSKTPLSNARVRITIVSAGRAIEQWLPLE